MGNSFTLAMGTFVVAASALYDAQQEELLTLKALEMRFRVAAYEEALQEVEAILGRRPRRPAALPSPRKEAEPDA